MQVGVGDRGAIAGLASQGATVASSRLLLLVREASRTLEEAGSMADDRRPSVPYSHMNLPTIHPAECPFLSVSLKK